MPNTERDERALVLKPGWLRRDVEAAVRTCDEWRAKRKAAIEKCRASAIRKSGDSNVG